MLPLAAPLQRLDASPVMGVSLANVSLLRLDLGGGLAPGNKSFKLRASLQRAHDEQLTRLISFGGAWSNHLHALAATGHEQGLQTVGIVRGEPGATLTPTLNDARAWGMQLVFVSRGEYRRRHASDYQAQMLARFGPGLLLPEGGGGADGVAGCMDIGRQLAVAAEHSALVVLGVGSGTTLAGVAAGLGEGREVIGVSALKGATDLEQRVSAALATQASAQTASWRIEHGFHCGGFARVDPALRAFILEFERVQGIPLEPVYTGKTVFAVYTRLKHGEWPADRPIVVIHTGGLQGRRGYDWLQ